MDCPTPNVGRRNEGRTRRFRDFGRVARVTLLLGVVGYVAAACGDDGPTRPKTAAIPTGPNLQELDPANLVGRCMGDDALAAGFINGMKNAEDLNCTANDIEIGMW